MKKLTLVVAAALLLMSGVVTAQSPEPSSKLAKMEFVVTKDGKPRFWKRALQYASFGAYQAPATVKINTPFVVQFDHDGVDTEGYQIRVTGPYAGIFGGTKEQVLSGTTGTMVITLTSLGSFSLTAVAYYAQEFSDPSNVLAINVSNGKPSVPTNLRKGL